MTETVVPKNIAGKKVLVVEDDHIQRDDIAEALHAHGADVVLFDDVRSSLGFLASNSVDIALLDIQLGDEPCYPIAERLLEIETPFVFLSGHRHSVVRATFERDPFCGEPCLLDEVITLLNSRSTNGRDLTKRGGM